MNLTPIFNKDEIPSGPASVVAGLIHSLIRYVECVVPESDARENGIYTLISAHTYFQDALKREKQ